MRRLLTGTLALGVAAPLMLGALAPATAQIARPLAAQIAPVGDDLVTPVRWRGGWGVGAGVAAGLLLGGALAARPYYYGGYYGYGPYYAPPYAYGPPAVYAAPPVYDDAVAYCMRRFRSYDPGSGTFLGFDGLRHPCP